MAKATNEERRSFRLHKDILWSIIKSQAGTLSKALMELVMNSIDAGATEVRIKLSQNTVEVSDDGKGFVDRSEIELFFETFGQPHEKGDARWGKFRMGRGQIMSFSKNRWRSGRFAMSVDIRDMGLDYGLTEMAETHKGCMIECDLYTPLSPSDVVRTQDEIRDMCKYTPVPVYVNGKQISTDPATEKWTMEDDDAYYLLRNASPALQVYNLGVVVCSYRGTYGIGGVVVSKRQLEVNFARNDILVSECDVWQRIAKKVREYAKQFEEKAPTQNESYRDMMMARLLTGNFENLTEFYDAVQSAKIFTDYTGKQLTLSRVESLTRQLGKCCSPTGESLTADKVQQTGLALVISPRTLGRTKGMGFAEVLSRIIENANAFMGVAGIDYEQLSKGRSIVRDCESVASRLVPLSEIASAINEEHHIVEDSKLSKKEKLVLSIIREEAYYVCLAVYRSEPNWHSHMRTIKVCESESAEGFTDGKSMIAINRNLLKINGVKNGPINTFAKLGLLLLHEYLHDASDASGHGHDTEFYERYHNITMLNPMVSSGFAASALRRWIKGCNKAGIPLRSGDLDALDLVLSEGEAGSDEPQREALDVPAVPQAPVIEQIAEPVEERLVASVRIDVKAPSAQAELPF